MKNVRNLRLYGFTALRLYGFTATLVAILVISLFSACGDKSVNISSLPKNGTVSNVEATFSHIPTNPAYPTVTTPSVKVTFEAADGMTSFDVYVRKENNVSVLYVGGGNAYENSITTANPFGTSYSYSESAGEKYTCVIKLIDSSGYGRSPTFAETAAEYALNPSYLPSAKYEVGVAASTVYDPDRNGINIEWTDEAKQYPYKN